MRRLCQFVIFPEMPMALAFSSVDRGGGRPASVQKVPFECVQDSECPLTGRRVNQQHIILQLDLPGGELHGFIFEALAIDEAKALLVQR